MTDLRRELALIQRNQEKYVRVMGQIVRWACFDVASSTADPIFNTGGGVAGRTYKRPFNVPALWINNVEANGLTNMERVDTEDAIRLALSMHMSRECGMQDPLSDDLRRLDIFRYRDQIYSVSSWEILGRHRSDDTIIAVSGIQVYEDLDYTFDTIPSGL